MHFCNEIQAPPSEWKKILSLVLWLFQENLIKSLFVHGARRFPVKKNGNASVYSVKSAYESHQLWFLRRTMALVSMCLEKKEKKFYNRTIIKESP